MGWAQDINNNNHQLETEMTAQDPVQECTDLINNRGCVKQFVNGGNTYQAAAKLSTDRDKFNISDSDYLLRAASRVFIRKLSFLSTFHPHKCTINVELQKISRQRLQFEISSFKREILHNPA